MYYMINSNSGVHKKDAVLRGKDLSVYICDLCTVRSGIFHCICRLRFLAYVPEHHVSQHQKSANSQNMRVNGGMSASYRIFLGTPSNTSEISIVKCLAPSSLSARVEVAGRASADEPLLPLHSSPGLFLAVLCNRVRMDPMTFRLLPFIIFSLPGATERRRERSGWNAGGKGGFGEGVWHIGQSQTGFGVGPSCVTSP